jgi:hypothetical protein
MTAARAKLARAKTSPPENGAVFMHPGFDAGIDPVFWKI